MLQNVQNVTGVIGKLKNIYLITMLQKDIFYQIYNSQKGVGDLVCKICDPTAFQ